MLNQACHGRKLPQISFEFNQEYYVVLVDYYSNFFEVKKLRNLRSESVIQICKQHFARYGILEVVMSDNGTQYSSGAFQDFAKQYGLKHITSSPKYPQSNAKAEKTVQTVKRLMKKS